MRNVIVSMMVTLDGYFAGPNGEIDWHVTGEEFNEYAIALLDSVDTLIFGRVTYSGMASYWPTPTALKNDPEVAGKMNELSKIVFSKTLDKVEWQNSRLIKEIDRSVIQKMKAQPGKDLAIFGSGSIVSAFTQLGLIDEYRLLYNPVVFGSGLRFFQDIKERVHLHLFRTKIFKSGLALLDFRPAQP